MFESIINQISKVVRNVVRAVGEAARKNPWLAPAALLALLLVV